MDTGFIETYGPAIRGAVAGTPVPVAIVARRTDPNATNVGYDLLVTDTVSG